jgi:hypothetical protein
MSAPSDSKITARAWFVSCPICLSSRVNVTHQTVHVTTEELENRAINDFQIAICEAAHVFLIRKSDLSGRNY